MAPSQFHITEESWGNHYRVATTNSGGSTQHFFVENWPFDPHRPDLAIHAGPDPSSPVLALSKFRRFSADCEVAVLADAGAEPEWMRLAKEGLMSPRYGFDGDGGQFVWKKTRSMGSHATPLGNMKLVEARNLDVRAVFSSNSYTLVTGSLEMYGE
ncbi:hypothetical protein N7462_010749 [Penicillium macrosclerotiorum]|uniref:uncharacterized protein n=1 Tax=Penicillium macrosclerotiorum TaxID=303699 RepID=UPI0025474BE8|nr:uncharacterized protein N7462_010749 [Penicillium macrosclerotiorum]KAJ5669679.1 hypothetical protein N7462_010749 [Penicillium macrosclerotiorum]